MDYNQLTIEALKYYQNSLVVNGETHQMDSIDALDRIINQLKK
jgi:hypothetical protein